MYFFTSLYNSFATASIRVLGTGVGSRNEKRPRIDGESRPKGSKDPNGRVLRPKYFDINGIWAVTPGPWTPRGRV